MSPTVRLLALVTGFVVSSSSSVSGQGEIGKTFALRGNGGNIVIWQSEYAADSGSALLRAGQRDLAARYLACVVPPGTRVLVMPMPYAHWTDNTRRVTVLDGKSRGCEGSVYSWDIYGNLKEREAEARKWRQEQEQRGQEAKEQERRREEERQRRTEERERVADCIRSRPADPFACLPETMRPDETIIVKPKP